MPTTETAELTIRERGILATSASAEIPDELSDPDRLVIGEYRQVVPIPWERRYYSRGKTFRTVWRDYGQPLPVWFDTLMQGLADLLTLPPDWDSYGAGPIDATIVNIALNALDALLRPLTPAPRVVPLSSGGLQVEWHRQGIDLEVVFDREEEPYFYYRDRSNGEECEYTLTEHAVQFVSRLESLE